MQFFKIHGSKNVDIKSKIMRDYMDPEKGKQFKNIDQSIIEIQKNIKHMPISIESIALKCRNDIANCKDFNELK